MIVSLVNFLVDMLHSISCNFLVGRLSHLLNLVLVTVQLHNNYKA